jgi:hypothetical protein
VHDVAQRSGAISTALTQFGLESSSPGTVLRVQLGAELAGVRTA